MNAAEWATNYLRTVQEAIGLVDPQQVGLAVEAIWLARSVNGTIWIVGNGGSAATASHFANDLRKMGRVKAIALADMVPVITAYGNDHGWDKMYSHPLAEAMEREDILVAISCGGNSPNVLDAARLLGAERLIVMTGRAGFHNGLSNLPAHALITVDCDDIRVQEDVHLAVCHSIAGILRGGM